MRNVLLAGLLCLGLGFLLGRYSMRPDTSGAISGGVSDIAKDLREAADSSLRDSTAADSLAALSRRLAQPRAVLEAPRATVAPKAEQETPDSVVSLAAYRLMERAYETERASAANLRRQMRAAADSLAKLAPQVGKLERAAGKVCGPAIFGGLGVNGKAVAGIGLSCDPVKLLKKGLGITF